MSTLTYTNRQVDAAAAQGGPSPHLFRRSCSDRILHARRGRSQLSAAEEGGPGMPHHRKWLAVTAACAVIGATLTGFLGTSAFASAAPSRLTELGTDLGEFPPAFNPPPAGPSLP